MSYAGFVTGSLIPHITANIVPTASYIAGTVVPFVAAHAAVVAMPLVGIGVAVGGFIFGKRFFK